LAPRDTLERERRWAVPAATAAILAPPLYIASLFGVGQLDLPTTDLATEQVRAFAANDSELLGLSTLRALSFVLLCLPLFYLLSAARAREKRLPASMLGFAFVGPILLGAQAILSWIAQSAVSEDFVAMAGAGGDIYTLLDDLTDESSILSVAESLSLPAYLGFTVALIYIPLQAMRVGLVTRFFGTLAMALGVATLLFPLLAVMPAMLWFFYLGLLFLGRVPAGRPPAWEAGVAIPWPRSGDEDTAAPPEAIEGEATELDSVDGTGVEEVGGEEQLGDHTARRQRARKRKRKRRR
jgi:hypothetical protein